MDIVLFNLNFIWINTFLALISPLFGWLMSRANSTFAKAWTGFVWFIFLPNTIYILTDFMHIFEDLVRVNVFYQILLIVQFSLFMAIGILTFVISIYFFQKLLEGKSPKTKKNKLKTSTILAIVILNFLVGFGVVLGGIERTNSWYVLTDPIRVVTDVFDVLLDKELMFISFGVGLSANAIYFYLSDTVIGWVRKYIGK